MRLQLAVPWLVASSVDASALKPRAAKPFCSTVQSIVTAAKQQSAATAFCSSYLHIGQSTATATTTAIVTTTTAGTPSTHTETDTVVVTATPTCGPPGGGSKIRREEKRAAKPKPSCFSKYTASTVISSACSCLSIPSGTTTTTITQTSTTTVQGGGGDTTVTTTTTSTSVLPATAPSSFRIYASGGPTDGQHILFDSVTGDHYGQAIFANDPGDPFALSGTNLELDGGSSYGDQYPASSGNDVVYFNDAATESQDGLDRLSCEISAVPVGGGYGCALFCSSDGRTVNAVTNVDGSYFWEIVDSSSSDPTFTPMVQATQ